ncbi:hypothetical protein [Halorientalis salina]|uniref:hypothetical protein n=1 Tax=Halorientalis salina TaxID=2932266 RepID=UPI0010ACBD62|nr:hypothetical protein [Halorientalis salina]
MTEHKRPDDQSDRSYEDELDDVTETVGEPTPSVAEGASGNDRREIRYVNDVVGVKGTSDEPVLDRIEYVQYVTSDQRRRRKAATNVRYRAALSR